MKPFRRETIFYLLALFLAIAVRLIRLGAWPLTDLEASWALQALGLAQGTRPLLGSQPAYVLLTGLLFFSLGGGTNFLARLVPALAGSALVLAPYLFRERLKPRPSLILAFFLAFDPGLVALSRQAGSSILVLTFLIFAWGFWLRQKPRWAGICAGLALLSGASLWEGLLGLALTWAIRQGLEMRAVKTPAQPRPRSEWLIALLFGLGTLLLGGTMFFVSPNGLSAWVASLPEYIRGWLQPSGIPMGMMLLSLIAYQPLAILLGLTATIKGWIRGSRRVMYLSLWSLVALLLALFYPAHQVSDLAWMLIPLWSLAALELAHNLDVLPEERAEVFGVIGLCVLILAFSWLDYLSLLQTPIPSQEANLRIWLLLGAAFMLIVSILLVAVGWSIRTARLGAVWGLSVAIGIYSLGALLGAAGLRATRGVEMWTLDRTPAQADLLLATVDNISDWSNNNINAQPVTVVGIDSPALQWLFRAHQVDLVSSLDVSASPPIVITTGQNDPSLAAAYRGQGLVWRQGPTWNQVGTGDWLNWLAYHDLPQNSETVIVWVRNDLFLDASGTQP